MEEVTAAVARAAGVVTTTGAAWVAARVAAVTEVMVTGRRGEIGDKSRTGDELLWFAHGFAGTVRWARARPACPTIVPKSCRVLTGQVHTRGRSADLCLTPELPIAQGRSRSAASRREGRRYGSLSAYVDQPSVAGAGTRAKCRLARAEHRPARRQHAPAPGKRSAPSRTRRREAHY